MKYLLDTQIILWALIDDKRLNKQVKEIIEDSSNEIYYSTVSAWEVQIKHLKNESFKLSGKQFIFLCDENGLINIQIKNSHITKLDSVKKENNTKHNDSFDKMLIAQAIHENMILITHDEKIANYSMPNIMFV